MPIAYWVHHLDPFLGPHWGNIGIRYYGLSYVLGFVAAGWLLTYYARRGRSQLAAARVPDLMMFIVFGVMIGGRVGSFVLYPNQHDLIHDPLSFFRIWEGGMASHGGFIGVAIALAWFARREKMPFLHLADLIVSAAPIGLFFGRVANFINGELPGKISYVPWAMIFPHTEPPDAPRHPSQLYEAGLEGLLLLAYMQWRFWRSDVVGTRPGRLSGEFLIGYAIVRMIGEIFREPDASLFFGLSRGTFYSVFLIVAGLGLILRGPRGDRVES